MAGLVPAKQFFGATRQRSEDLLLCDMSQHAYCDYQWHGLIIISLFQNKT